jgi:hypothetical protein
MMILEIKTFKNGYINYKWDIPTKKWYIPPITEESIFDKIEY